MLSMTKNVIVSLTEIIIDDLRDYPPDTAPWFNAAVYLTAMLFFHVNGWKALVVATIVMLAIKYNYGRRTLIRGGIATLFFTLAVWAEIIPGPAELEHLAHSTIADLR